MRKSIPSPPALSKSGVFLSNKTSPANLTTLFSELARHCYFDEIQNLRLELVANKNGKYNHDLGDSSARAVPFLVHEVVLSSQSSAVWMIGSAKKQACLMLSQTYSSCS